MIKYIGIAMISLSSIGFGLIKSQEISRELAVLQSVLKLMRLIRNKIDAFSQPLSEIYASFDDKELADIGFIRVLNDEGLSSALEKCRDALALRDSIFETLGDFSSGVGKTFSGDQVRHCDTYISLISDQVSLLEKETPQKAKAVRAISFAVAAVAAIILI